VRARVREAEHTDVVVVGGGLVGLAVARALALSGREVVVLEAEASLGAHASSRNSGVIHAGIYYRPGSAKAVLCVAGKRALYSYCEAQGVPHARLGKLLVATHEAELPTLELLFEQARANGVEDLTFLDAAQIRELEPEVRALGALHSPSSGIVDVSALLAAFKRDATENGAHVVTSTPVLAGRLLADGFELELGGVEPSRVRCRTLVNAAGLRAPALSRSLAGLDQARVPAEHYSRGHYFALARPSPFRRLVYPVPVPGGLGIHVTLELDGRARFGPDVSEASGVDYAFDETRVTSFYSAIRRYYPGLADEALVPGYVGVRPKLGPPGTSHDFVIQGPHAAGTPGFAALYGIESPGLTAALAIGDHVRDLLAERPPRSA
jgi:L-2-hydroxyglutarate oxidase LhgO